VTYVPYILAELPSNLILHRVGPRILLPTQVSTYGGLLAARFFLGLVEGGLFPGIVLYLSGTTAILNFACCNNALTLSLLQDSIDVTNYKCVLDSFSQPLP
jgi:hypothetical protein